MVGERRGGEGRGGGGRQGYRDHKENIKANMGKGEVMKVLHHSPSYSQLKDTSPYTPKVSVKLNA